MTAAAKSTAKKAVAKKTTGKTPLKVVKPEPGGNVVRNAQLDWVALDKMEVSELAQRDRNQAWVDKICNELELEQIGALTVNYRGGKYYVIDGQHRAWALRQWGFTDEKFECWVYKGLTEQQEAEMFLKLNAQLSVNALSKFKIAVTAGRKDQVEINRIVNEAGLVVSSSMSEGSIRAVGTLEKIYHRSGSLILARTLTIIKDAWGTRGLESSVLDAVAMVTDRYGEALDDAKLVKKLSTASGGLNALLNKAEVMKHQMGQHKAQCVAAAIVDAYNREKGGVKITSWWKAIAE